VDFSATRNQYPYGNGTQALQTSFSIKDSSIVTKDITLNLGLEYQMADYQTSTTGNLESYASGSLGLAYHLTKTLDLTADYQFKHETLTNQSATAQDNTFMIGLVYRPAVWTFSR